MVFCWFEDAAAGVGEWTLANRVKWAFNKYLQEYVEEISTSQVVVLNLLKGKYACVEVSTV